MAIDLHIHSTYSDGTYTPNEILTMSQHLTAISITDHDSFGAYENLVQDNNSRNTKIIPGIEITAVSPFEIHILGYFADIPSLKFKEELYKINVKRKKDILSFVNYLYQNKYIELSPIQIIKKKTNINVSDLYEMVQMKDNTITKSEFYYDKNFINGSTMGMSFGDIIQLIKKHNGVTSLAHPKRIKYELADGESELIKHINKLRELGLDAIECYHESFLENDINEFLTIANNNNLFITGGSDYHGEKKPNVNIGTGKGNLNIPDEIIYAIFNKKEF